MIFNLVMIVVALIYLYFVVRSINKNTILLENAGVWLAIGIVMLLSALDDRLPAFVSKLLGFELTSNFIIFLAIFFLLLITFKQSIQLSEQKNQIINLIQEISLDRMEEKQKK